MADSVPSPPLSEPKLCTVCNLFYGNSQTEWKCSKCFKECQVKSDSKTDTEEGKVIKESTESLEEFKTPEQSDPSRCYECNRRLKLIPFTCQCGFNFCIRHRLAADHSCIYDYKLAGKRKLSESNPVVKAEKVAKF